MKTWPAMQQDPNRPEYVLKVGADEGAAGSDDAADALRYLVATKSRVVVQRKVRGLQAKPTPARAQVLACYLPREAAIPRPQQSLKDLSLPQMHGPCSRTKCFTIMKS